MPELGCSLVSFEIAHPDAAEISRSLQPHLSDARLRFVTAASPSFSAVIQTPKGERRLG